MSKYINADEYRKVLNGESDERTYCINENAYDDGLDRGLGIAIDILDDMPSADVVEVKHGKWHGRKSRFNNIYYLCSLCGGDSPFKANFCPNCGADMRERRKTDG